ncbi:MAG TPA: ABC transporter substrate-binding protein [Acidimicrobiales bacterium]|nr:ABC transporter substrate-binding protein [Acidimicrobiales bacterium]
MRRHRKTRVMAIGALGAVALAVTTLGGTAGARTLPQASPGSYGTLPAQSGTATKGGVLDIAQATGAGPYYIFPIVPGNYYSVYVLFDFQRPMYRPLYWYPQGAAAQIDEGLSLASPPVYSDGDKTVTIHMDTDYTWSNGAPVEAQDVVFYIDLLKAAITENAANWGGYTPGQFPDNVASAVAVSKYTVQLKLNTAYNPGWFTDDELTSVVPLPSSFWDKLPGTSSPLDYAVPANAKKLYDALNKASSSPSTFASNPLWQDVDGPYELSSFDATTNAYSFVANKSYTGPQKSNVSTIDMLPFTSDTAEFDQLISGKLTAGMVDPADLSQVPALRSKGYNVYGLPQFGFNFIMLNFKDATNDVDKILDQLYVRQALDHLVDEPGLIQSRAVYGGAATDDYGTAPVTSPYAPSDIGSAPYAFDPAAASKLLSEHGWKVVPGGVTTCQRPGTGSSDCGAGIPAGQAITFNLFYNSSPPLNGYLCTAFASEAGQVGITVDVKPEPFSYLITNFNDPAAPSKVDNWAMEEWGGFNIAPYPTTNGTFNTAGAENVGGYSNPTANRLIHDSVYGSNPRAVTAEMAFLRTNLPVLWLPNPDNIWAWQTRVSGPPAAFADLTSNVLTPEYWYFKKQ